MIENQKKVFNFIIQRLKATQSERLIIFKFFQNIKSELKPKKNIEKVSFKAIWRLFKIIELSPNKAEKLLSNVKDERWFDREVIRGLRGLVMPQVPNMNEDKKEDEEEKKKRKASPLPNIIKQGGGIIVPLTTTVTTGSVPSLGPTNVFAEDDNEEMSVVEALNIMSQVNI